MGPFETGLDSPFHSKPIDPGFESCLGRSARLAGNAEFSPILSLQCMAAKFVLLWLLAGCSKPKLMGMALSLPGLQVNFIL